MPIDITMPRLSDTMEQGTIVKWHVAQGDTVESGDVLADVETDKATMEMQAYDDGTVASIAVSEGQPVAIGTVVAILAEEDEDPSSVSSASETEAPAPAVEAPSEAPEPASPPAPAAVPAPAPAAPAPAAPRAEAAKTRAGHVRISPVARRLAEEHGVDISTLQGSGPMGRIVKRDVLTAVGATRETAASVPPSAASAAATTSTPAAPARPAAVVQATAVSRAANESTELASPGGFGLQTRSEPLSNMRQVIASRLVESKQTIPHYQVSMVFNMDPMVEMRATLNEQLKPHGVKLTFNDLVLRCCALAMYTNPLMNASWGGDHIDYHGDVNVGVAVSLPPERGGGLVVATIRNADRKSLRAISEETHVLVDKARTKGLTVDEMGDATFTISNLGMYGVDNFTAIINPPNSAILALGAIQQKPVVRDGQVVVGHEMSVTLSNDHRVVDGATAAEYLVTLKDLIENPGMALV